MTEEELKKIMETNNSAIIAPAGHGKTEMITDIVNYSKGKQLILTHTNAGVDAIEKRLRKRGIKKEKYCVSTIASYCIKWCTSYKKIANFDDDLSPLNGKYEAKQYYANLYIGTKKIFSENWAGIVLKSTYEGIVVDEYQDCIQTQHEIILEMNKYLPVRVFGDPMQGIFSFAGNLVNWNNLNYSVVNIKTKPWRWENRNPDLGEYLNTVRNALEPILQGQKCSIYIGPDNKNVEVIPSNDFTGYSLLKELSQFNKVVYITKWPKQQLNVCRRMPGLFQYDEKQDCDELFKFAELFDSQEGVLLINSVISFMDSCSTGVRTELKTYIKKLEENSLDFSRIRKHPDFQIIIDENGPSITKETVLKLLSWFYECPVFKKYRIELISEMIRSIKYSIDNQTSIFEAANHIRKDSSLHKRYNSFKFLSSRTLLSKGLEFDCVIIDMENPLSAKDFYVAMTRAMKKVYIISDTRYFEFND